MSSVNVPNSFPTFFLLQGCQEFRFVAQTKLQKKTLFEPVAIRPVRSMVRIPNCAPFILQLKANGLNGFAISLAGRVQRQD